MTVYPTTQADAWFESLGVTEQAETVKVYHAMWKAYKAGVSDAEWKEKTLEEKLSSVESFSLILAASILTAGGLGSVAAFLPVIRKAQKYFESTKARERTAEGAHEWLSKRKRMNSNQRKAAFLIILWISFTDISESFGKGIDNWGVPWADWLSIWGWGDPIPSTPIHFPVAHGARTPLIQDDTTDYAPALLALAAGVALWFASS